MFEQLIVSTIVAAAAASVCWRWIPKRWRHGFKDRIAKSLMLVGYARLARWINSKSVAASGCGDGCSSCRACNDVPLPTNGVSAKIIVIKQRGH